MGLAWQQGPLATGSVGHFLTPQPMPERLLFAEPLRRRMRVRFGEDGSPTARTSCSCTSRAAIRWPTSREATYVPRPWSPRTASPITATSARRSWFTVRAGGREANHAAWRYTALPRTPPCWTDGSRSRWRADGRLLRGRRTHRRTRRGLLPPHRHPVDLTPSRRPRRRPGDRRHPATLGALRIRLRAAVVCAPRRHRRIRAANPPTDRPSAPTRAWRATTTSATTRRAAWSYINAWPEVARVTNLVSFEPDKIDVYLDGKQLHLEPGQTVVPHGIDRGLDPDEILKKDRTQE